MAVDLAAAVPSVRTWRYGALPEQLSPDQVQQVLDCRDRGRSIGRRDYAVLLLLARLGLRANEIATLTLDDVDWHSGRLAVSGKGRCRASLPLLSEVGTVLADYLEHGRPHSDSRRVFVRSLAPHTGFASSSGISMIAAAALSRAGLDVRRKGTHILIDRYFSLVIERLGEKLDSLQARLRVSGYVAGDSALYETMNEATGRLDTRTNVRTEMSLNRPGVFRRLVDVSQAAIA